MRMSTADLTEHVYCLGGTGVGKSRALLHWSLELIRNGVGVGVIDPHGELYQHLVSRIAYHGRRMWDQVILVDPLNTTDAIGLNPLELKSGEIAERRAQFLARVISKIFHADPLLTARMQRLLFHTFWLLIVSKLTLVEFVRVLTDSEYRNRLVEVLDVSSLLYNYWMREFPTNARLVTEWTQSSLNRIGPLTTDPAFAMILGQARSTVDFRQVMDEGKVLLINLPKGQLGEANSYLMGAFLLAQIQLAALSRADQPYRAHRQFVLLIDEFQNYVTDDIHEILAESRKYQLALIMAHQYYEQLRDQPKLQAAVLNTVGNLVVFRIGATDAEVLVKDIFTPPIDQAKEVRQRTMMTGMKWWPVVWRDEVVYRPLAEIWEQEQRRLTGLSKREFWYKRRGAHEARKLRTPDMPNLERSTYQEMVENRLTTEAHARWGRRKADIQQAIRSRHTNGRRDDDDNSLLFWEDVE